MAVWGGRTGQRVFEFLSREGREGGEVAERRNDNSPAIHGWVSRQPNEQVPRGTAEKFFRPWRDLEHSRTVNPAINGWAIFRGSGATAKTATGTGALPSKVPAGRPMAVWGGRIAEETLLPLCSIHLFHCFSNDRRYNN
jgi:hypothetical protein